MTADQTSDTGDGAEPSEWLDLDEQRAWIDEAVKPVAQGSAAIWTLGERRDLAVGVAQTLLGEVDQLRRSLARLRRVNGEWNQVMGVLLDGLAERSIQIPLGESYATGALAEIDRLREERDEASQRHNSTVLFADELLTENQALTARLAEAEKVIEALAPLIAGSKASTAPRTPAYEAVILAYDAYQSTRAETPDE